MKRFKDRMDAGKQLAAELDFLRARSDVVIVATSPGGVSVGYEVATALHAPLAFLSVQKFGVEGLDDLPLGAAASDGTHLLNTFLIQDLGLGGEVAQRLIEVARRQAFAREEAWRTTRTPDLTGKVVVLTDDGIATGMTMLVAARSAKSRGASDVVVAVPVMPETSLGEVRAEVDTVVCLATPDPFFGVANWFYDFTPPNPSEVRETLQRAGVPDPFAAASFRATRAWHDPCEDEKQDCFPRPGVLHVR